MFCKNCGANMPDGAAVCEECGAAAVRPAVTSMRQGRDRGEKPGAMSMDHSRPAASYGYEQVERLRPASDTQRRVVQQKTYTPRPHMFNRAKAGLFAGIAAVLLIAGGYLFLKLTDPGQLVLARMGRDANATAMWNYGQELLDMGYVERSIAAYETAYEKEPEREDMYARLQQLADAYEAGGYVSKAENTYRTMFEKVDEKNPSAYRAVIRIMEDQSRSMELVSLLKLAYEKTGESSFRRQREQMLPSTPTTDTEAGTLLRERDVTLLSAEDYEIYYLFGEEGDLPEDGIRYTTPLHLDEGVYILRAVAVSNDLVSDEMNLKYTIMLPSPSAPYPSLASGPYENRQRVWLRYNQSDEEKVSEDERQLDITIYYTLDGQNPTSNSPIYDGEPFYLPPGKSTLKAVAVNGYGKVSNTREVSYKVNQPYKTFFNEKDTFSGLTLMATTYDAFVQKFGTPQSETEVSDTQVSGSCVKLTYSWGEARFVMSETGYVLYYLDTVSTGMTGPRSVKVGCDETDITTKFRDMGQANDQNGDRSIYWDKAEGYAKKYHLGENQDRIDYTYYTEDGGCVIFSSYLERGYVKRMIYQYKNSR